MARFRPCSKCDLLKLKSAIYPWCLALWKPYVSLESTLLFKKLMVVVHSTSSMQKEDSEWWTSWCLPSPANEKCQSNIDKSRMMVPTHQQKERIRENPKVAKKSLLSYERWNERMKNTREKIKIQIFQKWTEFNLTNTENVKNNKKNKTISLKHIPPTSSQEECIIPR